METSPVGSRVFDRSGNRVPAWRDQVGLAVWGLLSLGILALAVFDLVARGGRAPVVVAGRLLLTLSGLGILWFLALRDYQRRRGEEESPGSLPLTGEGAAADGVGADVGEDGPDERPEARRRVPHSA